MPGICYSMGMVRIGIIGAGTMGGILVRRFATAFEVRVLDPRRNSALAARVQQWYSDDYGALARHSDVLVLAVKPQDFASVAAQLRGAVRSQHMVASIMAGVSHGTLYEALKVDNIARVMPNIAARYGMASVGVSMAEEAQPHFQSTIMDIMRRLGSVHRISERTFDAFTALSGSAIAFALQVADALALGGVDNGLPSAVAEQVAMEVCAGAMAMLAKSKQNSQHLVRSICSAGGTTIAGIAALEDGKLTATLMQAVSASVARARQMSAVSASVARAAHDE